MTIYVITSLSTLVIVSVIKIHLRSMHSDLHRLHHACAHQHVLLRERFISAMSQWQLLLIYLL